jgi:molybdenum cofactor biosynthesis protein B
MPGIDERKEFVPLKIAVLTISDTRSLKEDKSGALLVQRIVGAGHSLPNAVSCPTTSRPSAPGSRSGSPIL